MNYCDHNLEDGLVYYQESPVFFDSFLMYFENSFWYFIILKMCAKCSQNHLLKSFFIPTSERWSDKNERELDKNDKFFTLSL